MRLVYKETGKEVKVGDVVDGFRGRYKVLSFNEPHKASSEGKVYVEENDGFKRECYVSVIGAEWIEREDRN
jgi:hypothetical protein